MIPTCYLRYVEREYTRKDYAGNVAGYAYKMVLQQWWSEPEVSLADIFAPPRPQPPDSGKGEWRDVEVQSEVKGD